MGVKMKKIGIVTILSNNFGNRLQNYALQEVLIKLGYEVETIQKVRRNNNLSRFVKYTIKRLLKKRIGSLENLIKKLNGVLIHYQLQIKKIN